MMMLIWNHFRYCLNCTDAAAAAGRMMMDRRSLLRYERLGFELGVLTGVEGGGGSLKGMMMGMGS
jgi:hypothetical protein